MSAQAKSEAPDLVTIHIDGRELKAPRNAMIIEVGDEAGIDIPRFCYHKKLSIVANCRMCLVEVEKAPKPMPACATPVMDGMKVYTESPRARSAQKAVMEFLLINHPLDCPICDQGGECELQDLAMGYGRSLSRFTERKRVVEDKDVGPLIQTDMTRCIQCTRCVRFLDEIANTHELGGIGRGEDLEITTYVERAIVSELSGNIIDLCPVGALTDKPYRYTARAWELIAEAGVSPHDAVGSNLWVHQLRGDAMRIVPRDNESLNETWLSDRDRFGFRGLFAKDRVTVPMIRDDRGRWRESDWETALQATVEGLRPYLDKHGDQPGDQVGFLASPRCTVEELYLIQKLARSLGCPNVDHRLRQTDYSDQDAMPLNPALGLTVAELENVDAALLIGSNLVHDQPILAHRLRKACDRGARVMAVNPIDYRFHFDLAEKIIADPFAMVDVLIALARGVAKASGARPGSAVVRDLLKGAKAGDVETRMAETLINSNNGAVLLGNFAWQHPHAAHLRALADFVAQASHCSLSHIPESANSAGAWIVGAVPHRGLGGEGAGHAGLGATEMFARPLQAYVLFDVDAGFDTADPSAARAALEDASFVVHAGPFADAVIRDCANVLLPAATPPETDGTYVNAQVDWQMFGAAATPPGETRPLWKILRVLGTGMGLDDFGYLHLDQIRNEIKSALEAAPEFKATQVVLGMRAKRPKGLVRTGDVPIYAMDSLVRRSEPLQEHPLGERVNVRMNPVDGEKLGVADGDTVTVDQDGHRALAVASIDEGVPAGSVRVPAGVPGSETLGAGIGAINVIK